VRGGPWSPAVRRLLHERGIDPGRFDIGPHRLSLRILQALLATRTTEPGPAPVAGTVVLQATASVPESADLPKTLAAAVTAAWRTTQRRPMPPLVIDGGTAGREVTGPRVRLVLGTDPGLRMIPCAAAGEVVVSAGAPRPEVVPVRLPGGEVGFGCAVRLPLDLAVPSEVDGSALLRALVARLEAADGYLEGAQ
jgi:hypothetical protein